jgi:hypothetical protein
MVRPIGLLCAGTLLLLATGCTLDSFSLALTGESMRREQTIPGSLDSVSAAIRAALDQQRLVFSYSKTEDGLLLSSATSTGQRFFLALRRKKTAQGEQTVVRIEWVKDANPEFWQALLGVIASMPPQQAQSGAPTAAGFQPGL